MKVLNKKLSLLVWVGLLSTLVFNSCKKPAPAAPKNTNPSGSGQLSDEDSLKYLMYGIMQVSFVNGGRDTTYQLPTYFWNTSIPVLNPLSSAYPVADTLLADMQSYAINPATGTPYDRYSFLDRTGAVADQLQNGQEDNMGMQVTYVQDQSGNTYLYVLYADPNSPAGLAGINRGWEITAVNGSSNISYDGADGTNTNNVINAVYNSSTASFTFLEPDSASTTLTLNEATYNLNPVLFDSVYNVGSKVVGYFVFYTFSSVYDDNGNLTATATALQNVFSKFQAAGVNDIIVDLRYNGGGDVETSQFIDSLLAPASVAGQVMYTYTYNSALTANEANIGLGSQVLFNGGGPFNLDNVFFITTRNTASASELTLNNLKPYMSVQQVGDTSYGKPVGFFDFTITDFDSGTQKYLADLYAINYATFNASGVGGYYTGIAPNTEAYDYVNVPWGDSQYDDNLVQIFNYISTGSYARMAEARTVNSPRMLTKVMRGPIPLRQFNEMVDFRKSKLITSKLMPQLRRP